ncbi:hypothetical protein C8R43DRAFT_1035810 [Mycena crocata]|nr:hypothetical protein C8R43DRAFT_1035810 [Mycena crocata]
MFTNTVQPEIVSLFSSTGSDPLSLFGGTCDSTLPADSFIHLLVDKSSLPPPLAPAVAILPPVRSRNSDETESSTSGLSLRQMVLQLQSPTLRSTYIRCPQNSAEHLGLKHPWIHIQVRDMAKEWSLEIGLVDRSGHVGVVRLSTFQKQPRLTASPPLLHLPLSFPSPSSKPLTSWSTVNIHLPTLLSHFSSSSLLPRPTEVTHTVVAAATTSMPRGSFSHTSYVKVYATCRLRRIWFTQSGPSKQVPWEFELYGDEYR